MKLNRSTVYRHRTSGLALIKKFMWTYGKAGINLPRTAQQQYDVTQHIPLSEAQAGDLVFFHSTYNAGSYITHVGIYLGNNRMFHAGDPIGYADLTSPYWQQQLSNILSPFVEAC
ncbi:hypothetical protein EfmJHP36_02680 [Enterococcus faecium]|nr:hypothetical protein EfmJHP36_02680 [Enterococcus faecium]